MDFYENVIPMERKRWFHCDHAFGVFLYVCGSPRPRTYCLADSDEESSSAGSSDEEDPPEIPADKSLLPGAEG